MSAALEAVGLVSGVLGIVQFFLDNFPAQDAASGATVRLGVGLADPGGGATTQGGTVSGVFGYDANNYFIGQSDADITINDGEFADFTIHQPDNEMTESRFVYVGVSDDDICLQYAAVTQPNGFQRTILGDAGVNCGQNSYYANVNIGQNEDGSPYSGNCFWIDSSHVNGTPIGGFKADTDGFQADADGYDPATDFTCDSFVFTEDNEPVKRNTNSTAPRKFKKPKKRSETLSSRLIASSHPHQSAHELCDRPGSYGPDFVDAHGYFCDMETKRVFKTCNRHGNVQGCVHVDEDHKFVRHHKDDAARTAKRNSGLAGFAGKDYKTWTKW